MTSIPICIGQSLVDPVGGQVVFTLNIESDDLKFLAESEYGNQFFITSEEIEDVDLAYSIAGVAPPSVAASLAARVRGMFRRSDKSNLESYGDVVLLISPQAVADDIVVFNSDAKNLSSLAKSEPENVRWFSGRDSKLAEQLHELKENSRTIPSKSPRLHGLYFEARLLRALKPTDIEAIYLPNTADTTAIERARKIEQARGLESL